MPNFQSNTSILGQFFSNEKATQENSPIVREIRIDGGDKITPNFVNAHAFINYVAPAGNTGSVQFFTPIKMVNRSLFNLSLDNSNNAANTSKVFTFSSDYVFLDEPTGTSIITVTGGKTQKWFGAVIDGKLYLRTQSNSTN
jgi:hypothetical protein